MIANRNTGKTYTVRPKPGGASLDDVAAELGVTREGARQIEIAALLKLKKGMRRSGLTFSELLAALEDGRFAEAFSGAME